MKRFLFSVFCVLLLASCGADSSAGIADYQQGVQYLQGMGVEKDPVKAVEFLTRASDEGNAKAQLALGYLYLRGTGVPKDESSALKLFRRAAVQGDSDGQYNTGLAYVKGVGTKQNFFEAFKWFTAAALQGDIGSAYNLGVMYFNGEGVTKDPLTAAVWFRIAVDGKYDGASQGLDTAKQSLSRDQLSKLDFMVETMNSRITKPAVTTQSGVRTKNQPL